MTDSPGALRKTIGGLSGVLVAILTLLIVRQAWLWITTQDPYYITSTGLFAVIIAVLMIGVAWGFKRGETADKIFTVGTASLTSIIGFGAAYYWLTGVVLGNDRLAIVAGLALSGTAAVLFVVLFTVPAIANRVGSETVQ